MSSEKTRTEPRVRELHTDSPSGSAPRIPAGYNAHLWQSVKRGLLPFCPVCGFAMEEHGCFEFGCSRCRIRIPARPLRLGARMFNLGSDFRMPRRIFYRVVDGNERLECFGCREGKLIRVGELAAKCSFCRVLVKRDENGSFSVTYD